MDTATAAPATRAVTPPAGGGAAHAAAVLASEWHKFRTVRSTWWSLGLVTVFNVVTAGVLGAVLSGTLSASAQAKMRNPVGLSLGGLHLSQVAIGVLGVLVITSEYSTGMIRATLTAVPQRRLVLAAKTVVLAAAALVAGVATSWAAYYAFQLLVPSTSPMRVSLSDPGVVRAVTGAGLYLAALALLGFGLGAILRSSAGAMTALFGLLFVPRLIMQLLPASWQNTAGKYLPMDAGEAVYLIRSPGQMGYSLSPWTGYAVFCGYAAAALLIGYFLINHRDA